MTAAKPLEPAGRHMGNTVLEYTQSIVDTVREPLLVLDARLRLLSANQSFYDTFEVTPETSENVLLFNLGNQQWNIPRLRELLEEVLPESTTIEDYEVEHEFPDIGLKTMMINARSIFDKTGAATLILMAIEDITERRGVEHELRMYREGLEELVKKRTSELELSNTELQQFAYVASHDLQEPLRMVASYTQLLALRYKGRLDSDADEFIGYAVDGAERMQRIIKNLLAYSRLEAMGKSFMPTDATSALGQARSNLQVAIEESGALISNDSLPTVMVEETQLVQLLQNLLENAIKFRGDDPPRIHVSARREGDEWVFSVMDNGMGFDPQYSERIFSIFKRLHGQDEYAGTGIGLALCRRIVERHGGKIWAESEPGEGSTFYFTIPEREVPGNDGGQAD